MKIQKNPRTYISPELNIKSFEELLPYLNELSSREINSKEAFLTWLSDKSELDAVLEEDQAWRYIKMSTLVRMITFIKRLVQISAQICL